MIELHPQSLMNETSQPFDMAKMIEGSHIKFLGKGLRFLIKGSPSTGVKASTVS